MDNIMMFYHKKANHCFGFAILGALLSFVAHAQNVDSLVHVINHSPSAKAINDAKKNLPEHLSKIDPKILDVIVSLRAEKLQRSNISGHHVHERFPGQLLWI